MGDEHDRPLKVDECIGEHVDGGRIQVIGGLVQQERVRRFHEHASQGHTVAFPAAQGLDRFFLILSGKQEDPGRAPQVIGLGLRRGFGQGFQDRMLGVQDLGLVLGKIMQRHAMSFLSRAGLERQHAGQHFQ